MIHIVTTDVDIMRVRIYCIYRLCIKLINSNHLFKFMFCVLYAAAIEGKFDEFVCYIKRYKDTEDD